MSRLLARTLTIAHLAMAIGSCSISEGTGGLVRAAQAGTSIKTRQDACVQLGLLGDTASVPALIAMLDNEVLEWCAARSLGQLRDPRAAPALRSHLRLQRGAMNRMAVSALGEIGGSGALAALDTLQRQLAAEYAVDSAALNAAIAKLRAAPAR